MAEGTNDFRFERGTLYVNKRTVRLEERLEIIKDYTREYEYDPVKVHVGAATVGGFTTGGAYTTGGHYIYGDRASGRYLLAFKTPKPSSSRSSKPEFEKELVLKVVLSEEAAAQARNSPVRSYLNGCNIEVVKNWQTSAYYDLLIKKGQYWEAQTERNRNMTEAFPSREKCEAIRKWLCDGEDAGDIRKDDILAEAKAEMQMGSIASLQTAIELLRSIPGWKDADARILTCQRRIKEQEEECHASKIASLKELGKLLILSAAVAILVMIALTIMNMAG